MKDEKLEPVIRRIMVALDASQHSLAALQAASELADVLKAELVGIFVEDINLLRLAGLPFAREIPHLSLLDRPLDSIGMERQLRLQAERVKQLLAGVAAQHRLRWSFRVVRGEVAEELLTAAQEADLLALGRASAAATRRVPLGTTARIVVAQAPGAVLILQHGHAICQPVQVVYDGSATARRALNTAVHLMSGVGGELMVFLLADTPEVAQRLEAEATEQLQGREVQVSYRTLGHATTANLAELLRQSGAGTLVVGMGSSLLEAGGLQTVLEAVDCSVLLVR